MSDPKAYILSSYPAGQAPASVLGGLPTMAAVGTPALPLTPGQITTAQSAVGPVYLDSEGVNIGIPSTVTPAAIAALATALEQMQSPTNSVGLFSLATDYWDSWTYTDEPEPISIAKKLAAEGFFKHLDFLCLGAYYWTSAAASFDIAWARRVEQSIAIAEIIGIPSCLFITPRCWAMNAQPLDISVMKWTSSWCRTLLDLGRVRRVLLWDGNGPNAKWTGDAEPNYAAFISAMS